MLAFTELSLISGITEVYMLKSTCNLNSTSFMSQKILTIMIL